MKKLNQNKLYTRHNQEVIIVSENNGYAKGYIIGESGNKYYRWWYINKRNSKQMPYIADADNPSGEDVFTQKSNEKWNSHNAPEKLP